MKTQRHFKLAMAAAALLASLGFSGSLLAASAAVVTDVVGKATPDQPNARDLTLLGEIATDARVKLDDKARLVVVYYSSGAEFTLRGPAVVQFKAAEPQAISGNPPEKRATPLQASAKDVKLKPGGLARAAYMMMGAPTFLKLVGLSDTKILDTRPEFRWTAVEPVENFEVRIMKEAGGVIYSTQTTATSVSLPAEVALVPDARYTWKVSARLRDGTSASAIGEFTVAPADLRAQVDAVRPAESAALSQKIAFALWLEQVELRDEARKYWEVARSQRPNDAQLEALAAK